MPTIVPVVEGDGDAAALPELLIKILQQRYCRYDVSVAQGRTGVVKANSISKLEADLGKFLKHAQKKPGCKAILVLVDADNECPVGLAQSLAQRCEEVGASYPVHIVCARRSYESWFLASFRSIRGLHGIPTDASPPQNAEGIPDPKRWLSGLMPVGKKYKATTHQASFSRVIDIDLAFKNSRSFRRLCHAIEELLADIGDT